MSHSLEHHPPGECSMRAWEECVFCPCWMKWSMNSCWIQVTDGAGPNWFSAYWFYQLLRKGCWNLQLWDPPVSSCISVLSHVFVSCILSHVFVSCSRWFPKALSDLISRILCFCQAQASRPFWKWPPSLQTDPKRSFLSLHPDCNVWVTQKKEDPWPLLSPNSPCISSAQTHTRTANGNRV